jgi:hypothetical protein
MDSSASLFGDLSLQIEHEWYVRDPIEIKTDQSAILNERCAFCQARYALCVLKFSFFDHFYDQSRPIGSGLVRTRFVPEEIEFKDPIATTVENHIYRHV